mmetsp:Transcript_30227/g.49239  ORF Transcript_30227/g.49239 Transcript_30227/m.49239 type:complete len:195 (-) Transcript_30227:45-629(-)|eukprot:CAMPEP_0202695862 /NCGR_PEP_ID=MMETSP1385-20130828/9323_1 /ASSEMBLY_ACC=CAM_ASM_000861 /TAXON_ID=933848 /ORGANISM="Elphidium margaritaceum" /LENGTH=194 /DNA_ID=CAMNT_0049351941 /DNA_START=13 /DNA_END=597 /DNA_ORIENTATION=+
MSKAAAQKELKNPKPESEIKDTDDENDDDSQAAEDHDLRPEPKVNPVDFTGTWILKSSSDSIDDYYKSEGWAYFLRKAIPMVPMKMILTQNGNRLKAQVIVGPGGQFANETSTALIDSNQEFGYKDKEGLLRAKAFWNEDKTRIVSDLYRADDKSRWYRQTHALSEMSDKIMTITTVNKHGKNLVQTWELQSVQ